MANHIQEVKKSVSFVFKLGNSGTLVPNGTGFFVGVKNEIVDNCFNIYIVTAKHVLQDEEGNYFQEIALRLNMLDGDSQLIKIDLTNTRIYTHKENDVDIAVFICSPNEKLVDFKFIPNDLIATKEVIEMHEIKEGDEVFLQGYLHLILDKKGTSLLLDLAKCH